MNKLIALSISLCFASQVYCMEKDFNEGKVEREENKQNQTPFGTLSILPKDVISYMIYQIIEKYEDPVEAYEACQSFKLNSKFYDLIIDMLFSKFKYKYPSKFHFAVRINAVKYVENNINSNLDKINNTDSFGYTPLTWAMLNLSKEIINLLLKNGAVLADLYDKINSIGNSGSQQGLKILNFGNERAFKLILNLIMGEKQSLFVDVKILMWAIMANHIRFASYLICTDACGLNMGHCFSLKFELVQTLNAKEMKLYSELTSLCGLELDVMRLNKTLPKLPLKSMYDAIVERFKK